MRKIVLALFIISGLCRAQPATASPTDAEKAALLMTYLRIRDGVPPSQNLSNLQGLASQSEKAALKLQSTLNDEQPQETHCSRFIKISRSLTRDLLMGLQSISLHLPDFQRSPKSDYDFELTNRLRITSSALSEMNFLVESGAEGGYSILDLRSRTACEFKNRSELKNDLRGLISSLSKFVGASVGVPGLLQMKLDEDRLLQLALVDESHNEKVFWLGLGIGGTAVSAVLWKFGPTLAAATVRAVLGYTPRILAVPAFLYGVKVSALVAEGMAFSYADQWISSDTEPPRIILGTWDEHMDALEMFVNTSVHSPEIELAFLSRIHALIVADFGPAPTSARAFIESEEQHWGSIEKAVSHYRGKEMD